MTIRQNLDPQLHVLRTIARNTPGHGASQALESARFNLYAALEENDRARARQWATALRAALLVLEHPELQRIGLEALATIEAQLLEKDS